MVTLNDEQEILAWLSPKRTIVGAAGLVDKIKTVAVADCERFWLWPVYLAVQVSVTIWSVVGAEVTVTVPELSDALSVLLNDQL